ncbi:hypothetical protein M9458_050779, partial [Cirrhinus mrigala]
FGQRGGLFSGGVTAVESERSECHWNLEAQWDMFLHGLADYIKDEICSLELPTSLDGLVDLAIRVDTRLPCKSQSPSVGKRLLMGGVTLAKSSLAATLLSVMLQWSSTTYDCQALIDSGAEGNFLDSDLAYRLKLPVVAFSQPIAVHALNGLSLPSITHTTGPVRLITSSNHTETIHFRLTDTPITPVVLGLHSPHINWSQNSILGVRVVMLLVWCLRVLLCLVLCVRKSEEDVEDLDEDVYCSIAVAKYLGFNGVGMNPEHP